VPPNPDGKPGPYASRTASATARRFHEPFATASSTQTYTEDTASSILHYQLQPGEATRASDPAANPNTVEAGHP
jgi:hypothetical protein